MILVRAHGLFIQAINRFRSAMQLQNLSRRNAEIDAARGMLFEALADYINPHFLEETCAAGQLRRLECSWIMEQAIITTYQVQDEKSAVSDRLCQLQDKICEDAITVINCCDSHDELDFLFPEITRIYNHDLVLLNSWQNHIDWMASLPASELNLLSSANVNNSEFKESYDINVTTPSEHLIYENLAEKSHFFSLRDQLLFLFNSELRIKYELYINQQAVNAHYKTLVLSNLQQASDLTVANLYYYFKVRDESEDETKVSLEENYQPIQAATVNFDIDSSINSNFQEKIFNRIQIIIAEQLAIGANQITSDTNFIRDLGADSLDAVELIMAFEEEFDIEIPDEDATKIIIVQQVVDYIIQKVAVE